MAVASGLQHNLNGLLLVIGLAATSIGLGILGQASPNEPWSSINSPAPVESVRTEAHGEKEILASPLDHPGLAAGLNPTSNSALDPLPRERFSGEGAGRKGPIATSRDDQRAYLLAATALARNLAHTGGCKRTERPLGGDERACTVAAELPPIAAVPEAVE